MAYNLNSVRSYGYPLDEFIFPYLISGTINVALDVGKVVELDTTAANTVKLTTDNAQIHGRIVSLEDRAQEGIKVAAVAVKFKERVPYTGTAPTVGQSVTGSGTAGVVKVATSQDIKFNRVVEVDATNGFVTVEQL